VINADASLEPGDMPRRIAAPCRSKGQLRQTPAEYTRTTLATSRSGTAKYWNRGGVDRGSDSKSFTSSEVDRATRSPINWSTVTGRTAVAGPSEATAIANMLIQAIAAGELSRMDERSALVRASFALENYTPRADWNEPIRNTLRLVPGVAGKGSQEAVGY